MICVSEHKRQDFYKFYPQAKKNNVFVVHNGVDRLYRKINTTNYLQINDAVQKKEEYLFYFGNRGYYKNFPFVLELMNSEIVRNKNFTLVCVGGGKASKMETSQIQEYNLNDKIIFLSGVSSNNLNKLYN